MFHSLVLPVGDSRRKPEDHRLRIDRLHRPHPPFLITYLAAAEPCKTLQLFFASTGLSAAKSDLESAGPCKIVQAACIRVPSGPTAL